MTLPHPIAGSRLLLLTTALYTCAAVHAAYLRTLDPDWSAMSEVRWDYAVLYAVLVPSFGWVGAIATLLRRDWGRVWGLWFCAVMVITSMPGLLAVVAYPLPETTWLDGITPALFVALGSYSAWTLWRATQTPDGVHQGK